MTLMANRYGFGQFTANCYLESVAIRRHIFTTNFYYDYIFFSSRAFLFYSLRLNPLRCNHG